MERIPETYGEALRLGYKLGDSTWYRGYVSRRVNPYSQPVRIASGSRKGQLYVELPNQRSTIYSIRQYIYK